MSDNLTINASALKTIGNSTQIINQEAANGSVSSIANTGSNAMACTLDISREAMLRFQNNAANAEAETNEGIREKRKLLTREDVYISSKVNRHVTPDPVWQRGLLEIMKADEPETYTEYKELSLKEARESIEKIEENGLTRYEYTGKGEDLLMQSVAVLNDWFYRRCIKNGMLYNPLTGQGGGVYQKLNEIYPDMEFEVYSNKYSERTSAMHRYEYNILLSVDMVNRLAAVENLKELSKEDDDLMSRIDKAASDMRSIAGKYKESRKNLRLGVMLLDDGSTLYHAKYNGCENPDGITAGSKEELLEMMRKDTEE